MSTGLLGFETIEERQAGVDGYISASRLNCWLKCPLAFRLRYIDGIRTPTSPALFLGKFVHFGLEAVYRHRQLGVNLDAEQVAGKMLEGWAKLIDEESITFDSAADEQALRQQACDLVKAYLAFAPDFESRWPSKSRPRPRLSILLPAKTSGCRWSASSISCSTTRQGR